jgi:hypothetical protein
MIYINTFIASQKYKCESRSNYIFEHTFKYRYFNEILLHMFCRLLSVDTILYNKFSDCIKSYNNKCQI